MKLLLLLVAAAAVQGSGFELLEVLPAEQSVEVCPVTCKQAVCCVWKCLSGVESTEEDDSDEDSLYETDIYPIHDQDGSDNEDQIII